MSKSFFFATPKGPNDLTHCVKGSSCHSVHQRDYGFTGVYLKDREAHKYSASFLSCLSVFECLPNLRALNHNRTAAVALHPNDSHRSCLKNAHSAKFSWVQCMDKCEL